MTPAPGSACFKPGPTQSLLCPAFRIRFWFGLSLSQHFLLGQSRRAVRVRMEKVAAILLGFLNLHYQRMRLGISVITYAGHLPGDLHARSATRDAKLVLGDLLGDVQIRAFGAVGGSLIAEVGVKGLKPLG